MSFDGPLASDDVASEHLAPASSSLLSPAKADANVSPSPPIEYSSSLSRPSDQPFASGGQPSPPTPSSLDDLGHGKRLKRPPSTLKDSFVTLLKDYFPCISLTHRRLLQFLVFSCQLCIMCFLISYSYSAFGYNYS